MLSASTTDARIVAEFKVCCIDVTNLNSDLNIIFNQVDALDIRVDDKQLKHFVRMAGFLTSHGLSERYRKERLVSLCLRVTTNWSHEYSDPSVNV